MIKIRPQNILQAFILVTGVLVGAYFSNLSNNIHEKYDHTDFSRHANMDHGIIDITYDSIIPQIEKLVVFKDPLTGWNLHVQTKNFRFTPENENKKHIPGEGHAHLKINGNKIARLYGNWFHISELEKNENEIEVTLNANSHAAMMINNTPIAKKINQGN